MNFNLLIYCFIASWQMMIIEMNFRSFGISSLILQYIFLVLNFSFGMVSSYALIPGTIKCSVYLPVCYSQINNNFLKPLFSVNIQMRWLINLDKHQSHYHRHCHHQTQISHIYPLVTKRKYVDKCSFTWCISKCKPSNKIVDHFVCIEHG